MSAHLSAAGQKLTMNYFLSSGGHVSHLGESSGPFGSAVVPLVGVSSEDQPGAERRHSGQIRGRRLLEDTVG